MTERLQSQGIPCRGSRILAGTGLGILLIGLLIAVTGLANVILALTDGGPGVKGAVWGVANGVFIIALGGGFALLGLSLFRRNAPRTRGRIPGTARSNARSGFLLALTALLGTGLMIVLLIWLANGIAQTT
ncbi:MAG: hypothetical protein KDB54_07070 [Solirubrobacterales bacterium]|nr:hypothetical protein [Solirubrobacterales bacterium]MCB0860399.1 hypothetical protein [Solirubrobacterales bacterium]HRV60125.1 hypothetical protein [Solirubrobacterales bacterium]